MEKQVGTVSVLQKSHKIHPLYKYHNLQSINILNFTFVNNLIDDRAVDYRTVVSCNPTWEHVLEDV